MSLEIASASTHPQLETLSRRYAAAIDRRDPIALLSVFEVDATLRVEQPDQETGILTGHRELSKIIKIITRWPRTVHLVAQGLYDVSGDVADGEVYCIAHRFDSPEAGKGRNHVMYIRYRDRYRRTADNRWLISSRTVGVDAIEDRPVTGGPQ